VRLHVSLILKSVKTNFKYIKTKIPFHLRLTLWLAILPSHRPFVSLGVQVAGGQKSSQIRPEIQPFRTQIQPRINSPFSYPVRAECQASILEPRSGRPSIPEPISRRKPTLVSIPLLHPRLPFSVLVDESGFNRIY